MDDLASDTENNGDSRSPEQSQHNRPISEEEASTTPPQDDECGAHACLRQKEVLLAGCGGVVVNQYVWWLSRVVIIVAFDSYLKR